MSTLVQHTAKNASFEERMAICKGIQYIGEPCVRVLDFRMYFYELCNAYEFNGVKHFLDQTSIDVFNALIEKTGGRYTIGVYEELSAYAKRRYAQLPEEDKNNRTHLNAKTVLLNRHDIDSLRKTGIGHKIENDDIHLPGLCDSIEQRLVEERFVNNLDSLHYVISSSHNSYRPLCVCHTKQSEPFWQSLQLEQESCFISGLVMRSDFQMWLGQRTKGQKYFLVKSVLVNDRLDFIALDLAKLSVILQEHPDLAALLREDNIRLLKLDYVSGDFSKLQHFPSLLTSKINLRLQNVNREPSIAIKELLKKGQKLLSVQDMTPALKDLPLLHKHLGIKTNTKELPVSLLHFVLRPRYPTAPVQQAIIDSGDQRRETRYLCNTQCIVIDVASKSSYKAKTLNLSTKGLAIRLEHAADFDSETTLLISLPGMNKRMNRVVKNQPYQVVAQNGSELRLMIEGQANDHQGRRLLEDFLRRFGDKLNLSDSHEQLPGLVQTLRHVVANHYNALPFTFVSDKRATFVEHLGINLQAKINNLMGTSHNEDICNLLSSSPFINFIKSLYLKMQETQSAQTGYLLLLPRVTTKSGQKHEFWLQDFMELSKKQPSMAFIEKLKSIATPSILAVRLQAPEPMNGRYWLDEYHHLQRLNAGLAASINISNEDILAVGEVSDITSILTVEQPAQEEEMLIEVDSPVENLH